MTKIIQIVKRDGRIVDFDQSKITEALYQAGRAVGIEDRGLAQQLSNEVVDRLERHFNLTHENPSVEKIQDMVEEILVKNSHYQIVKAYILYRHSRSMMRDINLMINSDELIDKYLKRLDWKVKENSNMTFSLQGLNNYVCSEVSSHYWLNKIYPNEIGEAHRNGDLHIHDLQLLSSYCCGWDLKDLLLRGFGGVEGKIESAPAKHLRSALGQLVNFFYTLQGESAGAQAFSSFDTYLAPFIRYDNYSYEDVKAAMQSFIFNMNVPTRVGFQTPFTNITLDLVVPEIMKNEPVIIGGELQKETYGDFQEEMNMINKVYAEVMVEGDSKGRVFTFPIPTYNITKDFDWENPVLDTIMEMTAKYGIPYFSNFINSDMDPNDARSMCCRLRLDNRELRKRGGGLFGANPLTGSIGVVTINMPRLGYLSNNKQDFFDRLGKVMDVARDSLEIKRKSLEKLTEYGLFPYTKHYLDSVFERFGSYWQNHFNTIGLNGLNEAIINLIGKDITDADGHSLAVETLDFMRERLVDYQEESGCLYNLEATPAEGCGYRFAKLDKESYPDIICANEQDYREKEIVPYYTNSSQLPVSYTSDIFEALELQDDLQTRYTGGTVLHGFIGERLPSVDGTKSLIKKIAENYKLPYYTITPTFSVCPKHGYLKGVFEYCPRCDEESGYSEEGTEVKPKKVKVDVKGV
jgi:ribonucleoside-triphosphate reductase